MFLSVKLNGSQLSHSTKLPSTLYHSLNKKEDKKDVINKEWGKVISYVKIVISVGKSCANLKAAVQQPEMSFCLCMLLGKRSNHCSVQTPEFRMVANLLAVSQSSVCHCSLEIYEFVLTHLRPKYRLFWVEIWDFLLCWCNGWFPHPNTETFHSDSDSCNRVRVREQTICFLLSNITLSAKVHIWISVYRNSFAY